MWIPNRTKYRKHHKENFFCTKNTSTLQLFPRKGRVAIVSCEPAIIQSTQLESARRVVVTSTRRYARTWSFIFTDVPRTAKPKEARMGHGKGSFSHWVGRAAKGAVLYEFTGTPLGLTRSLEALASDKFSMRTRLIRRRVGL
jgi:ribosomal protein L16